MIKQKGSWLREGLKVKGVKGQTSVTLLTVKPSAEALKPAGNLGFDRIADAEFPLNCPLAVDSPQQTVGVL